MIFTLRWRHCTESSQFKTTAPRENLTIHERPTARWGSLIWITHNRKVIFKTALSPGRNQQEQSAKLAWSQVRQTLEQQKIATLFMDTFDLEHDEL